MKFDAVWKKFNMETQIIILRMLSSKKMFGAFAGDQVKTEMHEMISFDIDLIVITISSAPAPIILITIKPHSFLPDAPLTVRVILGQEHRIFCFPPKAKFSMEHNQILKLLKI